MKTYNYKYIIGFIIGIILCGGIVYAEILYNSNIVYYNKTNSTLNSTNVQAAIDELATKYASMSTCPSDKGCIAKKSTLALGDYVSYTPGKTSYTTDPAVTGYTDPQTINPSELNLWRVISINQDGTVDIISENVSSTSVIFGLQTGYQNYVGYLNLLAKQYETENITVRSRHYGYNGQTPFIDDTTYFKYPAPWTCETGKNCTPDPDDYEAYGGGDTLYLSDYDLVYNVLGTRAATKPNGQISTYWIASRYYKYFSEKNYAWYLRNAASGTGNYGTTYVYRYYNSEEPDGRAQYSALRPIVTLSSSLSYSGVGNKDFPMEIQ